MNYGDIVTFTERGINHPGNVGLKLIKGDMAIVMQDEHQTRVPWCQGKWEGSEPFIADIEFIKIGYDVKLAEQLEES